MSEPSVEPSSLQVIVSEIEMYIPRTFPIPNLKLIELDIDEIQHKNSYKDLKLILKKPHFSITNSFFTFERKSLS